MSFVMLFLQCLLLIIMLAVPLHPQVLAADAPLDVSKLQEVTAQNQSACVEYFKSNGKLYCSTERLLAETTSQAYPDKLDLKFDGRPWQAAWGKQDEQSNMVEYVVAGESIDHWQELVTSQYYAGLQTRSDPEGLMNYVIGSLKQQGFEPEWTVISKTPNETLFEYKIHAPAAQVQHEIQRIFVSENGIYVVHYVIKKHDMGMTQRAQWITLLKAAQPKG